VTVIPTARRADGPPITLGQLEQAALRHRVPVEDALLIAINLHGISSA
jgi:hypothetical protein